MPGHELVGECLSAEDVDGPGVVVGDEAAAPGALLRLVLLPQTLPRAQAAAAGGRRGGQEHLVVLRPQGLKQRIRGGPSLTSYLTPATVPIGLWLTTAEAEAGHGRRVV